MHFGGTIISDGKLDKDSTERIRNELDQTYKGPTRAGKWFIGDGGLKVTTTTSTARDAQFTETLQYQVESICRWMGVPPHKVHHLLRMTYNNVEQMSIDVVGDTIIPWAMRLEQEATYKLFGNNRSNLCVVYEVKGLLRGAYKDRQEGLQIQRRNGIINANDWCEIEDIPKPKDGGDTYIVESNMMTMEQLANPPEPPKPVAPTQTANNSDTSSNDNNAAALSKLLEANLILENINA